MSDFGCELTQVVDLSGLRSWPAALLRLLVEAFEGPRPKAGGPGGES